MCSPAPGGRLMSISQIHMHILVSPTWKRKKRKIIHITHAYFANLDPDPTLKTFNFLQNLIPYRKTLGKSSEEKKTS